MIYEYLTELSKLLRVNIMAYDYTGYGLGAIDENNMSAGFSPSEEHAYADINAAYDYLTTAKGISPASIILYGRSVGSGPSCYLAQRLFMNRSQVVEDAQRLGGVILHSPFLSVLRVVMDLGVTLSADLFPNSERVSDIRCPIFIIHGTHDEVVPFGHGKTLHDSIPQNYRCAPFWAEKMGHNDIEVEMTGAFVQRLKSYILLIDSKVRNRKKSMKPRTMKKDSKVNLPAERDDSESDVLKVKEYMWCSEGFGDCMLGAYLGHDEIPLRSQAPLKTRTLPCASENHSQRTELLLDEVEASMRDRNMCGINVIN